MIIDSYKKLTLNIEDVYFSDKMLDSKADICRYIQYFGVNTQNKDNSIFHTNTIDLNTPIEQIQTNFRKSIKSEINQATKKHGISTNIYINPEEDIINEFCEFYDNVSSIKNLASANKSKIVRLRANIVISAAVFENQTVVWHLYIYDKNRIRLLYSCSKQTEDDDVFRIVSKGNKLLHFHDIKMAKDMNVNILDFGGVSLINDSVAGIDQFKLGFSKEMESCVSFTKANSLLGKIALFCFNLKR